MIGLPLQVRLPGVKVRESPGCHGWETAELNAGGQAGPEPDSHSAPTSHAALLSAGCWRNQLTP